MSKLIDQKKNLEILISTTEKNDIDFIENIFFENNYESFPILIVNQSDKIIKNDNENTLFIDGHKENENKLFIDGHR